MANGWLSPIKTRVVAELRMPASLDLRRSDSMSLSFIRVDPRKFAAKWFCAWFGFLEPRAKG